jgi:peptidoglycan/LPS O-acetylase OafA/YrhL
MSSQYNLTIKPQKLNYIPALDGIRAIALLLVLFSHSVIFDQFTSFRSVGLELGYAGVSIFFVLSGYLITRLLIQEEEKTGSISLNLFYIRRAFRLLPALWLYLLVVWVLWVKGLLPGNPWYSFITSLFYIRNLIGHGDVTNHLWSLSIEEQFYLLWPILLVIFPQQNYRRFFIILGITCIVVIWRCYAITNNLATYGNIYIRTDFRFDSPLIGCALALLERIRPRLFKQFNYSPFRSDLWLLIGVIMLIVWIKIQLQIGNIWGINSTVTSLIGGIIIISQIINNNSISKQCLTIPPLILMGKISYSVYLWQGLFLGYQSEPLGFMRKFPIGLILSFFSALISYILLEKPLLKIKDNTFKNKLIL